MIKSYIKSNPKKTVAALFLALALSIFLYFNTSKNTIEVYIGSTSEEVSSTLKKSLAKNKSRGSTIVITRTNIRPKEKGGSGKLLNQELKLYSKDLEKEKNIAVTTDKNLTKISNRSDIVQGLTKKIKENTYPAKIHLKRNFLPGFKLKMAESIKNGQPIISVAKIGGGPTKKIFVELPEMGFQARLSYSYGAAILDAIKKQFPKNKIKFTTIFAGENAASINILSGKKRRIDNNINIRLYKDKNYKNKYVAKISTTNLTNDDVIFQTHPHTNPFRALETARFVFLRLGGIPAEKFKLSRTYLNGFLYKTRKGKILYRELYNAVKELQYIKKNPIMRNAAKEQIKKILSLRTEISKLKEEHKKRILKADGGSLDKYINHLRIFLIKKIKDGNTSISGSYFSGDLTKEAGNNIGKMINAFNESGENHLLHDYKNNINTQVINVNMEDDIVFRMYRHINSQNKPEESNLYTVTRTAYRN